MPNVYQGTTAAAYGRFAIVVSRFNESITFRLLDGAVRTLISHGVAEEAIDVAWVPGAFEIPTIADRLAAEGRYVAVLCLGAVIRGVTPFLFAQMIVLFLLILLPQWVLAPLEWLRGRTGFLQMLQAMAGF